MRGSLFKEKAPPPPFKTFLENFYRWRKSKTRLFLPPHRGLGFFGLPLAKIHSPKDFRRLPSQATKPPGRRRSSSPGGQGFPACRSSKSIHRRNFDGSPRRQPSPPGDDGRRRPGGKVFQLVARQNSFTEGVLTAPPIPLPRKLSKNFLPAQAKTNTAP